MELEVIGDVARLEELRGAWNALARSVAESTPFQMPEWQLPWWSHFGSGRLHVLAFHDESQLVGLMPGFLHQWNGHCQWTLLGTGISDYTEPLILLEARSEVVLLLQTHLVECRDWERCVWQDLNFASPLIGLRESPSLDVAISEDVPCSAAPLTRSFAEFWESRSKDLKRNFRRYTERARLDGALDLLVVEEAEPAILDVLIRLHGERWRERGETGMIEANNSGSFLRDIASAFGQQKMLRIFDLRYKGASAAIVLTLPYANTIYSYMSAFDPAYDALGLGRNLLHGAFRHCFEHGIDSWNFLRGEEPYKASWGAKPISKLRVTVVRR